MPTDTWKSIERAICKMFGGIRSGPVGKTGPDCKGTGIFAVQVKHRSVPKWLIDAVEQSIRDAAEIELPVLVLHNKHGKIIESLVVFRLKEWREWYLRP